LPSPYYFFGVIVIRYETTAAARRALLFIVRAFFKNAFTVAIWTSFHVHLMSRSLAPGRASDLKHQRPTQKGAYQNQPCGSRGSISSRFFGRSACSEPATTLALKNVDVMLLGRLKE
jgi:hypothetical protein